MIGLDTNILARYITQDDPSQSPRASRLIETRCTRDNPGYVSRIVLCELALGNRAAACETTYSFDTRLCAHPAATLPD